MPIVLVAALIVGAGVFLVFLGLAQSRREAGGSEDFQARLAQYGVGEAYVPSQRPAENVRERINRLFSPAAERVHRGDAKKGKPPRWSYSPTLSRRAIHSLRRSTPWPRTRPRPCRTSSRGPCAR